jgi:hypothetical protein
MLATQTGAFCRTSGLRGIVVQFRTKFGTKAICIVGSLASALSLCGCANVEVGNKDAWFSKPFEFVSRKGGYSFSELQETKDRARPITANDLVDNSGSCPAPQQAAASAAANQAPGTAPAADANGLVGLGIGLGMSECEVVSRAGTPNNVQIGNNPNGARSSVITFNSGPRPGIYHFEAGALTEIDRVPGAPPPPQTAKKKSPATAKSSKQAAKE